MLYLDQQRVMLKYLLPLSEIVIDFYDQVKTISSGYARYIFHWFSEILFPLYLLIVNQKLKIHLQKVAADV